MSNRVVFDIGHGSDTYPPSKGIILPDGSSFAEHSFNAKVGMRAKELAEYNGFEVLLSQQPNAPDTPLKQRSTWINTEHRKKSIICLMSFHANASSNPTASGWGVLYWHSSTNGKKLAQLWAKYAEEMLPIGRWGTGLWESKPNSWSNMHILRETIMPAILIEHFFFTNFDELKKCNTPEFIELAAQVAVKALCEYAGTKYKYDKTDEAIGTPIMGKPQATIEQAIEWARKRGAHQRFLDVAEYYWYYGELTGIRPEVLYSQAAKETNFGKFTGNVKPEQNNWAGIKVAKPKGDRTEDHETFASPKDGVRCHFNHIGIYCGVDPIGEPHPRWYVTKTAAWAGTIKTVEELGGKWAPNPDYGKSIVRDYLNGLLATKIENVPENENEGSKPNQYIITIQALLKEHGIDIGLVDGIANQKIVEGVRQIVNRMALAEKELEILKNNNTDDRIEKAKEYARKILDI